MNDNRRIRSHTVLIRLTEEEYETLKRFSQESALEGRPPNVSGEIRKRIFTGDSSGKTLLFYAQELQKLRSELHQVMQRADVLDDDFLKRSLKNLIAACDEALQRVDERSGDAFGYN